MGRVALDDDGDSFRDLIELHPKSVLWQARLGIGGFSAERVEAAQLEVAQACLRAAPSANEFLS